MAFTPAAREGSSTTRHDRPIEETPHRRGVFLFYPGSSVRTPRWVRGGAVRGLAPWPAASADRWSHPAAFRRGGTLVRSGPIFDNPVVKSRKYVNRSKWSWQTNLN